MILCKRLLIFIVLMGLSACGSLRLLAPTPNIYTSGRYPQNDVSPAYRASQVPLFFVTDRTPVLRDGLLTYGSDRSNSAAFGASTVAFGEGQNWGALSAFSGAINRGQKLPLSIVENREIIRFNPTPAPFRVVNGKPVHSRETIAADARKRNAFQQQIVQQMQAAGKNEVTIFVHGFNNSFEDGIFALSDIWHFSGRSGVPISYSWPSGAGGLFGYFTDREAGEFTVFHFKEFLTQLSQIPELEKIHIVAHSRGSDVTTTALRELIIAARNQGKDPKKVLKIKNLVLAAPDLDFSVVRQRLIAEGFGAALGQVTVYMNRGDTALGIAQRLMTGQRLGRLTAADLQPAEQIIFSELKTVNFVNVEGVHGVTGHAYYRTNPNVLSDISTIIRTGSLPGTRDRPLTHVEGNFWNMPSAYPFQ